MRRIYLLLYCALLTATPALGRTEYHLAALMAMPGRTR